MVTRSRVDSLNDLEKTSVNMDLLARRYGLWTEGSKGNFMRGFSRVNLRDLNCWKILQIVGLSGILKS